MSYVPAKYGVEYIFYVGLESVATAGTFQSSATIASGDVKVSKDGGALANITTLPAVTPGSSKLVKVTVSATEMEAQNVTVIFSDASGGEWNDLIVNIQTAARQIDDLAYPTTSGRSIDVTTTGGVGIDWGNVENPTTTVGLTGTTVATVTNLTNAPTNGDLTATMKTSVTTAATAATPTAAAVTGAVGSVTGSVGSLATQAKADVNAEVLDVLNVDTFAEPTSAPAATSSLRAKIGWLFKLARNKMTQTSTTTTLYADDGTTADSTSAVADNGTTMTRDEWS